MSERTWGFDFEGVQESSFEGLPPGHYTLEVAKATFKVNKAGEEYLSMEYTVLDSQDSDLIGKTHYQYVSLDPERLRYSKGDFRRMGVPEKALTNEGGPEDMIGTVFECDLVKNDKDFINMRHIQARTNAANAAPPEKAKPSPTRATSKR
jgi:hypothetical protein